MAQHPLPGLAYGGSRYGRGATLPCPRVSGRWLAHAAALLALPLLILPARSAPVASPILSGSTRVEWALEAGSEPSLAERPQRLHLAGPEQPAVVQHTPVQAADPRPRATPVASEADARFSPRVERWRPLAEQAAAAVAAMEGVSLDADLLLALVKTESGGDPAARSDRGAGGLTQLGAAAFADLVARYPALFSRRDRYDPYESLLGGGLYLVFCARYLGVDLRNPAGLEAALNAYNLGPEAVRSLREVGHWRLETNGETTLLRALPEETELHARRVLAAVAG